MIEDYGMVLHTMVCSLKIKTWRPLGMVVHANHDPEAMGSNPGRGQTNSAEVLHSSLPKHEAILFKLGIRTQARGPLCYWLTCASDLSIENFPY